MLHKTTFQNALNISRCIFRRFNFQNSNLSCHSKWRWQLYQYMVRSMHQNCIFNLNFLSLLLLSRSFSLSDIVGVFVKKSCQKVVHFIAWFYRKWSCCVVQNKKDKSCKLFPLYSQSMEWLIYLQMIHVQAIFISWNVNEVNWRMLNPANIHYRYTIDEGTYTNVQEFPLKGIERH